LPERRRRMRRLQRIIQRNDVHRWVDSFLRVAFAKSLEDFRRKEDYVPAYYPTGLNEIPFAAPSAGERSVPSKDDSQDTHQKQPEFSS
jgi:hypothetical protein